VRREAHRECGGGGEDGSQAEIPGDEKPAGIPIDFVEHARLMFDLQVVAFQADLTRISTLMLGREGSTRTYERRRPRRASSADAPSRNEEMIGR